MSTLTIRLPDDTAQRLKSLAQSRGLSMNKLVEQLSAANAAKNKLLGMVAHDLRNPLNSVRGLAEFLRDDGSRGLMELDPSPVYDDGKLAGACGVARDVTEQARLEQLKSDFINRAAHELRTPLTTVVVMAELIREGGKPEEIDEYWRILTGELQRQKTLVERLLTAGRMEAGSLPVRSVSCDAGALLAGAVDAAGAQALARGVSLVRSIPDGLPFVAGDPSLLPQVFANLLDNAVKFTPSGGRVSVEASVSGAFLLVRVSDTGIGIPPEDVPQLFGRFFRARNAVAGEVPGSGMGLYVVKSIVERSGGRIGLSSEPERGTTVEVALPALPALPRP